MTSFCVDRRNQRAFTADLASRITVWDCKTGEGAWLKVRTVPYRTAPYETHATSKSKGEPRAGKG